MPLIKSKSASAFLTNLKAELHAGKRKEVALAIAYQIKRDAQKKKS